MRKILFSLSLITLISLSDGRATAQQGVPPPDQYFGFTIGADGELARYPKILDYFQLIAKQTDRVKYEELGKTTMGNSYPLLRISSPQNLAKFDRLVEINRRLADPRGLSDAEARTLAAEGKPFYFIYATIHSTEVSNGQAIIHIVHRLATENSPQIREILDNSVVLMVPSQNPDGQHLVIDHWYKTKGTPFNRVYPDLYHKYVGHDDNRDWFMFTQKETRMSIELVQNKYKPIISHDMHQQGPQGSRIFVPPFTDPFDVNIHPLLALGQATVGQAMASALLGEGKEGVAWNESYDMWSPARQYMIYHGQPRILTEIASSGGNLADPFVNPQKGRPLGPQESRGNFPVPYSKDTWTLGQQMDYGITAAIAGMSHVAKYGREWLYNFYTVHKDWVNYSKGPYAFVVPAAQRDQFATYEMLEILEFGDVEIHRATAPFTADGKQYAAGSYVVKTAQPYGAFAKTMLEKQIYPDLRLFPGGPPQRPYDVTGHTLWMLTGVTVDSVEKPFDATLEMVKKVAPVPTTVTSRPKGAYLVEPGSYGFFKTVTELQKANVPVYRAAKAFEGHPTGTWVIPPTAAAQPIIEKAAREMGAPVTTVDRVPAVDGFRLKPATKVGLWKGANNMPGGWLLWMLEQYGITHEIVKSQDFTGDLNAKYDVILLPSGTSKARIVSGLDPKRNDPAEWSWAFGVGDDGWKKLKAFVENGGTLLAIGTAVETARELLDLPIEKSLPEGRPRFGPQAPAAGGTIASADATLRDAFSSPARLMQTLRDRVADPESLFFCPGSLLQNEFDVNNPVAWGMPAEWPVFFEGDQAYRLRPGFGIETQVVSRYPTKDILQSGWLLGEEYLRDQANILSFRIGKGYVVTYGSQVDFRTQPRATFKLIFNAMFHGPSTAVPAAQMGR
ncbi:MAG: M14 family metallopeptidase [Acidobacteriota bacterium]|nr:M14 family metallopeptidase [Acidobacteriota bacterium]